MKKNIHIAMAGGGTGGHVFPIKSLIEYFLLPQSFPKVKQEVVVEISWFGNKGGLEEKECGKINLPGSPMANISHGQRATLRSVKFISILSGKFRRETKIISNLKNIGDILKFIIGFFQSFFYLLYCKIDVIFCKGGHVALPVVLAGALLRKKIVLHESDTKPGLTNKIAAQFATKIFTGFDAVFEKGETVGQIVSSELFTPSCSSPKISELDGKTNVLVLGGSQGSRSLYHGLTQIITGNDRNTDVDNKIPLVSSDLNFYIVLGLANKEYRQKFEVYTNVSLFDFVDQQTMGGLYRVCDIGITRGGTTSLAEQKLFDMKLAIVPIPWTHDQYQNAKYYEKKYGDVIVDQKNNFESELRNFLLGNIGFKKKLSHIDRLKEIEKTKEKIWNELVPSLS